MRRAHAIAWASAWTMLDLRAMATVGGGALDGAPIEATQDALFGGSVVLFQPPRGAGYRTNVDALLLAAFAASPPRPAHGGAGVGVPQTPARARPAAVAF